jgi:hypothetical protein
MKMLMAMGVLLLSSCTSWATDKLQPLDLKLGLWETTVTTQTSGMPPMPPEVLAQMTPEQREQMEAAMAAHGGQGAKPVTSRSCMTKEKLEKGGDFGEERKECKRTIVDSSSSNAEIRMSCEQEGMKTNATVRVQRLSSESVKGSMRAESSGGGHTMNINSNFTSKWISADCGKTE